MKNTEAAHVANTDRRLVLTKAVLKAGSELGLDKATIAKVIGVSASFITRMTSALSHHNEKYALKPDTTAWQLSTLLVRLFRGIDAITAGDPQSRQAWMQNYNTALNGIPAKLITTITGLVDTVEYVDASRAPI
jgi:hypothetical protein